MCAQIPVYRRGFLPLGKGAPYDRGRDGLAPHQLFIIAQSVKKRLLRKAGGTDIRHFERDRLHAFKLVNTGGYGNVRRISDM